ncbi:MAG TPA: hypothetical protein VFH09_02555 [Nitrososphaera sp.]|nr:hypothetical protein [Nitrososphaera sp.]
MQIFSKDNYGFGGCNTMTVLGYQNQNMLATDDADEFDKFDVKRLIQHRTQGTVCAPAFLDDQ